ncbi:MAG TPA: hypothetical protein VHI13_01180 [Candidatus Kapabacteria bacterium]|nr:hypothetical protein [Candidatus Kapabacteria bacterium]
MKILTGLLVMAALCLSATVAHATTKIERNRYENGAACFDWIKITVDNCWKLITRDCDDNNPCGWHDGGWICGHPDGGDIYSSGDPMLATFDGNGNLICTVAPGTGGVYSSGSSSNGVCFAADNSSTLMISASIMGGLH